MKHLALSISLLANAFIPGGLRYEMLSSRAYRRSDSTLWEWLRVLIDVWFAVLFKEQDHCKQCWEVQNKELGHIWGPFN